MTNRDDDIETFLEATPPAARIRDRLVSMLRSERLLKIALKLAEKRESLPVCAGRAESGVRNHA